MMSFAKNIFAVNILLLFSVVSYANETLVHPYPLSHSLSRWVYWISEIPKKANYIEVFYLCNSIDQASNLEKEFEGKERRIENRKLLGYKHRVIVEQPLSESTSDKRQWIIDQYYLGHKNGCVMDGFQPMNDITYNKSLKFDARKARAS